MTIERGGESCLKNWLNNQEKVKNLTSKVQAYFHLLCLLMLSRMKLDFFPEKFNIHLKILKYFDSL